MLRSEIRRLTRGSCHPGTRDRVRVVVSFGGSDSPDATSRVLRLLPPRPALDVVVIAGPGYHHDAALHAAARATSSAGHAIDLHRAPADPGALFVSADVAVCSAGGTLGELAYLGCPALAFAIAPDQVAGAAAQADAGLIAGGHDWTTLDDVAIAGELVRFLDDATARADRRERALATVDGEGARRVVTEALLQQG
jgi:spore coat polysaccharide biosynthesis predicted glycosyltransferase SpsG